MNQQDQNSMKMISVGMVVFVGVLFWLMSDYSPLVVAEPTTPILDSLTSSTATASSGAGTLDLNSDPVIDLGTQLDLGAITSQ